MTVITSHFDALIFDFNGVLLWDHHINDAAWQETGLQLLGRQVTEEEMIHRVRGRPNRDSFEWFLGRKLTHEEVLSYIDLKESCYRAKCLRDPEFHLSPGAESLLEYLVANRIPHTIATMSEKTNLDFFIRELHLDRWFDTESIVYDDLCMPGKPAPDIYLKAAAKLHLDPQRCIVVEDSISGLQAAISAHIGYVIALGPKNNHAALRGIKGVDTVIESLAAFPRELLLSPPTAQS